MVGVEASIDLLHTAFVSMLMTVDVIVRCLVDRKQITACVMLACIAMAIADRPTPAFADQVVSCGGFAMLGGAQINCSHLAPKQPTQFCTFSWSLMTTENTLSVVQGAFVVPPGANGTTVYQGAGFNSALGNPVVLCQGRKSR